MLNLGGEVHQAEEVEVGLVGNEVLDLVRGQGGGEVEVVVEDLDGGGGRRGLEDDGDLHGAVGGAVEVVRVAGAGREVERRLGLGVTRAQDLDDVGLTTAALLRARVVALPARAAAVLAGAGDSSVKEPVRGHVLAVARLGAHGHLELSEEDLVRTGETLWKLLSVKAIELGNSL